MRIRRISKKQRLLLKWAFMPSTRNKYRAVICDGAVRSGKTLFMSMAFVLWAMGEFDGGAFGICGKTVGTAERNIILPLMEIEELGALFSLQYKKSQGLLIVRGQGRCNRFYLFGGKDESSQSLIQGVTLSGILLDEAALMPRSFVEQAVARTLSVPQARLWFNCNPENPQHYIYKEWIEKAEEKRVLHLHFSMEDNPILTKQAIKEAAKLYSGVFYRRYILGEWVAAEGLVYPMFQPARHVVKELPKDFYRYIISCDYGTVNPFSMGLWAYSGGKWYRIREYYHDSKRDRQQLTDEEYCSALTKLAGDLPIEKVIVDPSAASFMECIRRQGRFRVEPASNRVLDGIRQVAARLSEGDVLFHESCKDSIREFGMYRWDEKSPEDRPLKTDDHAMDEIRYFVRAVFSGSMVEF